MNVIREIERLNDYELQHGFSGTGASWHAEYSSPYVFIGGLDVRLSEGDILRIFSQFGEVVDLHLLRDRSTGQSRGFGFLAYEDVRSCILAIDNLNGVQLVQKTLRVDHAEKYSMHTQKKRKRDKYLKDEKESSEEVNGQNVENAFDAEQLMDEEQSEELRARRLAVWNYELYGLENPFKASQRKSQKSYESSNNSRNAADLQARKEDDQQKAVQHLHNAQNESMATSPSSSTSAGTSAASLAFATDSFSAVSSIPLRLDSSFVPSNDSHAQRVLAILEQRRANRLQQKTLELAEERKQFENLLTKASGGAGVETLIEKRKKMLAESHGKGVTFNEEYYALMAARKDEQSKFKPIYNTSTPHSSSSSSSSSSAASAASSYRRRSRSRSRSRERSSRSNGHSSRHSSDHRRKRRSRSSSPRSRSPVRSHSSSSSSSARHSHR